MNNTVLIKFHAELKDFLPLKWRNTRFDYALKKTRSVKDLIESIGIPHTEVDIITVNGISASLRDLVKGGENINVYPAFVEPAAKPLIHNLPKLSAETRFVVDVHLGRLAGYLRMLGFHSKYRNDYDDAEIMDISAHEKRIVLTSDRRLLMRKLIDHGYYVRSRIPRQQILEVFRHYRLKPMQSGQKHCIKCNGIILRVDKAAIESRLLPLTKKYYNHFYQCQDCQKIYWEGSHHNQMRKLIEEIEQEASNVFTGKT